MILPAPGPLDVSRLSGAESTPDSAGVSGGWPQPVEVSGEDFRHALNPLQHVPVVGMIYRAATDEQIPSTLRVLGAGLLGGPLGMIGAGLMSLFEELLRMGPDTSRPPVPAGMSMTGSESGVEPVTPGTLQDGQYTTLATTTPEFLDRPNTAIAQNGAAAYQNAALEYQRSQFAEKGLA